MDTAGSVSASGLRSINAPLTTTEYLVAMWDRRTFAIEVPLEQLRSEHKTTLLGNLWHLGNPLLAIAVYYLVFGVLLQVDRGVDNFLLWLTIGVFSFRLSQHSVLGGAASLPGNSGLIRAIKFPRALLPVSVVIGQLMTFMIELGVLGAIMLVAGVGVSRRWLALPVVLAVHTALNLGGALVAARLGEGFRDIQQILPFGFRMLQYLSGVMFPIERLLANAAGPDSPLTTVVSFNPLLHIIELYRWVFLGTAVDVGATVRTAVIAGLVLWFGFRFFRAAEWRYGRA